MLRTICFLAGCALLLGSVFAPCKADTISLSVQCGPVSKSSNQPGSISCSDSGSQTSAQAAVNVDPLGFASASGSVSSGPMGGGFAFAEARYTANFQLLVTNGSGTGFFAPCFFIPEIGGMASFGQAFSLN